jgi:Fe-S-cluster-containing dehydrogenase component
MSSVKDQPLPFWRSLSEATDPSHLESRQQTPPAAAPGLTSFDRRQFLRSCGASFALSAMGGCSRPPQGEIVPYIRTPSGQTDGVPRFFASTLLREGYGHGVLVESNMGRPTKIEGNPQHPASLGSTDIFAQAAVLELWDPDRSQAVMHGNEMASAQAFIAALLALQTRWARDGGAGLRVLTGPLTSPTLRQQLASLLQKYPAAHWHAHQPVGNDRVFAGTQLAFGERLAVQLHLERATVLLALDADFLCDPAAGVRYAREFAAARAPEAQRTQLLRMYAVEATPSLTGAMADHRLPLESTRIQNFARQLARLLGIRNISAEAAPEAPYATWLRAVAEDLRNNRGTALVVVGPSQPPWMHALGHLINASLGGLGTTVSCREPVEDLPADGGKLSDLVDAMHAGTVDSLLVLDRNPAYDAPADLGFTDALRRVPHLLHLGLYRDETGRLAEWHLPMAHALEAWSDARAFDGTASIVQPIIAPLYRGRSVHELVAALLGDTERDGHALIRRQWQARLADDAHWNAALQTGVINGTNSQPRTTLTPRSDFLTATSPVDVPELELLFRPDPTVSDGRWSNNAWLQELPKPLTQLTWDNPALISPALAAHNALANGDVVELRTRGRVLRVPVWIIPGQAAGSITLHLGYGRRHAGHVGDGCGFDAYALRANVDPWWANDVELRKTAARYPLADTQQHFTMDCRDPVRIVSVAGDSAIRLDESRPPSLYPERKAAEYAWAMSIDLNACIGCKVCTIACQAENNIPVVGKEEVRRGREMHWIRVDRYHAGSPDNPLTVSQPVPCMMCEHAPCELVCPVDATVHDAEGLNVQVYNRCVGTRFCSNNCPYKVRRFNFLQYVDESVETLKAQRNPDVTVRRRGVMEKCTYCIQRIEGAHILADREGRRIGDGDIVTACQAVCPTQAIRFGDGADPRSSVAQAKGSARNYVLLGELNTRPRTSYLARVRNPNPQLKDT